MSISQLLSSILAALLDLRRHVKFLSMLGDRVEVGNATLWRDCGQIALQSKTQDNLLLPIVSSFVFANGVIIWQWIR
jgi:hypothetical protein